MVSPENPDSEPRARERGSGAATEVPARFSVELTRLIEAFGEREVLVKDVVEITQSRGYVFLLLLLTIPFCTPIPLPGLSLPFGLAVAVIGLRLALGQKPWLPARVLNSRLPPRFFSSLLKGAGRLVRWLEWFLRPRMTYLVRWEPFRQSLGTMIFVSGCLLLLPLPIPFCNGLPACTVILLAAAMLEEDGYAAIAGCVLFLLTLVFFAALAWSGAELTVWLKDHLGSLLARPDDAAR